MKLLTLLTLLSFFLVSCDAPVRTRVPTDETLTKGGIDTASQNEDEGDDGDDGTGNDGNGNNGNNQNEEPGYEDCAYLTPQFNGGSIGYFGVCQNSNDERGHKAIFAESSTQGTCFVPIHIQNSGNSFKLGRAECVHNQANKNYYMTLTKELVPPNFSYPRPEKINGVMVIKATSLNAYMGCMNSKEDFFISTQGCCYNQVYNPSTGRNNCINPNPQCDQAANNYANNVCNAFVQAHTDNYRQVNF